MSGAPAGTTGPGSRAPSVSNGPPSAGIHMPPQQQQMQAQSNVPQPVANQGGSGSQQNLNQIVLEYLSKKGYNRTEAMLRKESASQDAEGRPNTDRAEDMGGEMYQRGFDLLKNWIEDNLDIYKSELRRLLWPVFVYSLLNLASDFYVKDCEKFYESNQSQFSREHELDLRALSVIKSPEHVHSSNIAKLYRDNKYRISLSHMAFFNLIQFLESKDKEGGSVVLRVLQAHLNLVSVDRSAVGGERSLAALLAQGSDVEELPAEDEGIPGHNPGSANTSLNAPKVLTKLNLGKMPMEAELMEDVRGDLQDEDMKNPPKPHQSSLVEEFERQIKQEPNEDAPNRDDIPLPPSLARDVALEVQKVKENRDRFKIEGRTGGKGPGLSITMFTFHNTFDKINCIDFSGDTLLVAAGMAESYIRIWTLDGSALPVVPHQQSSNSRRLIGHSGPVFQVSFSPGIESPAGSDGPNTTSRFLLSCSEDKTVRLWSLDTWSCLVAYRSHTGPVWDVKWGPQGHYFLTGSNDRTARLWSTEHIEPLRLFVGHDSDVDVVTFHPNGAYVFTASNDKTVRMWDISRGTCVRMYTGHTGNITAIEASPNGQLVASADDMGSIHLWDLHKGRRLKHLRGHGKGGIWSLSFSVESTVLVSGGADCTVRVWHVTDEKTDPAIAASMKSETNTGVKPEGSGSDSLLSPYIPSGSAMGGSGTGKKGKGKDVAVSPEQIDCFPTKSSPVYEVSFTRMNLVLAGSAFMP